MGGWSVGVRRGGVTSGYTGSQWDSLGALTGVGVISGAMGTALRTLGKLQGFRGQALFLKARFSLTPHFSPGARICAQPWG